MPSDDPTGWRFGAWPGDSPRRTGRRVLRAVGRAFANQSRTAVSHPTEQPFVGRLQVGGVELSPGALERDQAAWPPPFAAQWADAWFAEVMSARDDGCPTTIAVSTRRARLTLGRRGRRRARVATANCRGNG